MRSGRRGSEQSKPPIRRDEIIYTLLQLVPPGMVTTYSSLARAAGVHPRTAALILSKNPDPIVIPCHRVVKSDGSLGGYRYGGPRVKEALLRLEGVEILNGRVRMDRHFLDVYKLVSMQLPG